MNSICRNKVATININSLFPSQLPNVNSKNRKPIDPSSTFYGAKEIKIKGKLKINNVAERILKNQNGRNISACNDERQDSNPFGSPKNRSKPQAVAFIKKQTVSPNPSNRVQSPMGNYCAPLSPKLMENKFSNTNTREKGFKSPNLANKSPLNKIFNRIKSRNNQRRIISPNSFMRNTDIKKTVPKKSRYDPNECIIQESNTNINMFFHLNDEEHNNHPKITAPK